MHYGAKFGSTPTLSPLETSLKTEDRGMHSLVEQLALQHHLAELLEGQRVDRVFDHRRVGAELQPAVEGQPVGGQDDVRFGGSTLNVSTKYLNHLPALTLTASSRLRSECLPRFWTSAAWKGAKIWGSAFRRQ